MVELRSVPMTVGSLLGGDPSIKHRGYCADCGAQMEITDACWQAALMFSRVLMARNEAPLSEREIARCDSCAEKFRDKQAAVRVRELDRDARLCAEMRRLVGIVASEDQEQRFLRDLPDGFSPGIVASFRSHLAEARTGEPTTKRAKSADF